MKKLQRKITFISFTQQGLDKLKLERDDLFARRVGAVATLKAARELGDLSENGLYKGARARLSSIDHQLERLDDMIKRAKVEEVPKDRVGIGSVVTISDGSKKITYTVVGGYESDPFAKKISHHSPIGSALMNKTRGETVEINVPAGKIEYTVENIG